MDNLVEGAVSLGTERSELDVQYGLVLQRYIADYFNEQSNALNEARRVNDAYTDVDISDSRHDDMSAVHAGDFEVRNVRTAPTTDRKGLTYHFYVGQRGNSRTEVHIMGNGAKEITRRMDEVEESA